MLSLSRAANVLSVKTLFCTIQKITISSLSCADDVLTTNRITRVRGTLCHFSQYIQQEVIMEHFLTVFEIYPDILCIDCVCVGRGLHSEFLFSKHRYEEKRPSTRAETVIAFMNCQTIYFDLLHLFNLHHKSQSESVCVVYPNNQEKTNRTALKMEANHIFNNQFFN